jgi:hypothetical protein
MFSKSMALSLMMAASTQAFAGADLLGDTSYQENRSASCFEMVQSFAKRTLPDAARAAVVVPLSHVSITQGTDNQTFVSVVNVNEDYYTVVSEGSYSCDYLNLVNFQKIKVTK